MDPYYASSASVEWYTPAYIVEGVIAVMGAIDCDPCSNPPPYNVPATVHYTRDDDGLLQPWGARVFVNPPYGDALSFWINKLLAERALGRVTECITLTPARTDTRWFQPLWEADALCFVRGRLNFSGTVSTANSSTAPTVLAYFGPHVARFAEVFSAQGQIIYPNVPYRARAHQLTLLEGVA
jgi:hypothetical protein